MAQLLKGTVVADKSNKTIVVKVSHSRKHPLYRKNFTVSKKFYVHDETNKARIGDVVEIIEVPQISKTKQWNLNKVVEKTEEAFEDIA